ncbi:MAG: KilA-N domain-containing protein [Lachnospiraceae bacterium]|nr:KilA-N domain-containing protein [Lachnospiraceae bacterium]
MAKKMIKETIHAKGFDISIYTTDFENEFISLTDIAKYKSDDPNATICNWMRNRETLEFLGLWEGLNNPDFNPLEFEGFRTSAGLHSFTMSPTKWINAVKAIGIVSKAGRYGGTYAHSDIALEFASWISAEFKLYIVKDYQRIKRDENSRLSLNWNLNREIAKLNYRIHTDAVKANLIPPELTPEQISYKYASEADMLNVAVFGKTAKEWRDSNPGVKGNIRDQADLNQLLVLANAESYNAVLIDQGKAQSERLILIRQLVIRQIQSLGKLSMDNLPMFLGGEISEEKD